MKKEFDKLIDKYNLIGFKNMSFHLSEDYLKSKEKYMTRYKNGEVKIEVIKPVKSDLMELKEVNSFKLEKLVDRYELRLTGIEKKLIYKLRIKGINVSEEIRKFILSLEPEETKKLIQEEFDQNLKRLNEVVELINQLEQDYIKSFKYYLPSDKNIQKLDKTLNGRYSIKFKIYEAYQELYQLDKYIVKYGFLFGQKDEENEYLQKELF